MKNQIRDIMFSNFMEAPDSWMSASEIAERIGNGVTPRQVSGQMRAVNGFFPEWVDVDEDTRTVGPTYDSRSIRVRVYRISRKGIAARISG